MRVKGGVIAFLVVGVAASVAPAAEGVDALDVGAAFVPTGRMGDAEAGTDHVQIATGHATDPHSDPSCIQVSYTPGTHGWAGVYWQNRSGNWGEHPGENLKRAGHKRLTFWARGESGGAIGAAGGRGSPGGAPGRPVRLHGQVGSVELSHPGALGAAFSNDVEGGQLLRPLPAGRQDGRRLHRL